MYNLRESIRKGRSVADGLREAEHVLGGHPNPINCNGAERTLESRVEPLLDGAFLARDPEDGQNLLTYAAAWGRGNWFLYLANRIRQKVYRLNIEG